jgi:hypothetical protein
MRKITGLRAIGILGVRKLRSSLKCVCKHDEISVVGNKIDTVKLE